MGLRLKHIQSRFVGIDLLSHDIARCPGLFFGVHGGDHGGHDGFDLRGDIVRKESVLLTTGFGWEGSACSILPGAGYRMAKMWVSVSRSAMHLSAGTLRCR